MAVSKESFSSAAGPIPVDVYLPQSSGKHPAVLILHGTLGLEAPFGPDIVSFAKALAWTRGVPIIPVHHLAGHIESLVLQGGELPLPAVVLVVSGGHTSLYRMEVRGTYELLGRTRDDAAG